MLSSDDHSVNKKKYLSLNVYARARADHTIAYYRFTMISVYVNLVTIL